MAGLLPRRVGSASYSCSVLFPIDPDSRYSYSEFFQARDKPQIFYISRNMALSIGTKAPDFSLSSKTADGSKVGQAQRQFWKEKYAVALLPDGIYRGLHGRVVRNQCRA